MKSSCNFILIYFIFCGYFNVLKSSFSYSFFSHIMQCHKLCSSIISSPLSLIHTHARILKSAFQFHMVPRSIPHMSHVLSERDFAFATIGNSFRSTAEFYLIFSFEIYHFIFTLFVWYSFFERVLMKNKQLFPQEIGLSNVH